MPSLVAFDGPDGAEYRIDATETTAAQYHAFLEAVNGLNPITTGFCKGEPLSDSVSVYQATCQPDAPASVNFCSAKAYCEHNGKTLCSDTAWSLACSNGGKTKFPYGDTMSNVCDGSHQATERASCRGMAPPFDSIYDMSGNLAEWTDECVTAPAGVGGAGNGMPCHIRGGDAFPDSGTPADWTSCGAYPKEINPGWANPFHSLHGVRCCQLP